jgi:hypothetical protein
MEVSCFAIRIGLAFPRRQCNAGPARSANEKSSIFPVLWQLARERARERERQPVCGDVDQLYTIAELSRLSDGGWERIGSRQLACVLRAFLTPERRRGALTRARPGGAA